MRNPRMRSGIVGVLSLAGACAQASPARVLAPSYDTTATLLDATSGAAVRADRLLSGLEALGFSLP